MRRNGKAQIRAETIGNGMVLRGWALNREGRDELRVAEIRKGIDRRCNGEAKTGRETE